MPRAGLTPESVVAEAARLCDEDGFDSLSPAVLARRLGVATPSLYKHVAGLDELRRRVALASVTELADRLRSAVTGRSGAEAVHALSLAYRKYAHERPGCYTSLQRAPRPEDAEAHAVFARPVEVIASVLQGFAIPEERMVHTIRTLRSSLHGFVDLEINGGFGLPEDVDESFALLVDGIVLLLERRHPQNTLWRLP
ncbi:TetR/AcrR family transcriptional regulator [Nocardiopsis alba]|jgi:AcrR family transcriptional regulator|uniref:TetR/AcrR family transcriptional regulator n=1 Tax=Nocardiopsis alba TaxID=53437 RepID=UPI0033B7801B